MDHDTSNPSAVQSPSKGILTKALLYLEMPSTKHLAVLLQTRTHPKHSSYYNPILIPPGRLIPIAQPPHARPTLTGARRSTRWPSPRLPYAPQPQQYTAPLPARAIECSAPQDMSRTFSPCARKQRARVGERKRKRKSGGRGGRELNLGGQVAVLGRPDSQVAVAAPTPCEDITGACGCQRVLAATGDRGDLLPLPKCHNVPWYACKHPNSNKLSDARQLLIRKTNRFLSSTNECKGLCSTDKITHVC